MQMYDHGYQRHTGSLQVDRVERYPHNSNPMGGTLGTTAAMTLAGEDSRVFAWSPRIFIFEIKLSSDCKNICLFFKN